MLYGTAKCVPVASEKKLHLLHLGRLCPVDLSSRKERRCFAPTEAEEEEEEVSEDESILIQGGG